MKIGFTEVLSLQECTLDPAMALFDMEKWGRVCYKSEDKITPTSCRSFLMDKVMRGHTSVLRHSNIIFKFVFKSKKDAVTEFTNSPHGIHWSRWAYHEIAFMNSGEVYVNGNYCAWMETFIDCPGVLKAAKNIWDNVFKDFIILSNEVYPKMTFQNTALVIDLDQIPRELRKWTAHVSTNRAISHQLVRHQKDSSFSQESQRYCTYNANVGSPKELTVICPVWAMDGKKPDEFKEWEGFMKSMESMYFKLKETLSAQDSREVLANSVKTELVMTKGFSAWISFFDLRSGKEADPTMRYLAMLLISKLRGQAGWVQ